MRSPIRHLAAISTAIALGTALTANAMATSAKLFKSPEILILGDSQLSFGSGPAFLEFFQNIKSHCKPNPHQARDLRKLGNMSVGIIGVRSTSLHSWAARKGRKKDKICKVDRRWKKNAGSFGIVNPTRNKYVQIGKGEEYQFCEKDKSAFEAMFSSNYYAPKLLIMSFLGNAAGRWAGSKKNAIKDVEKTMAHIPKNMPCIFMTTAPAYKKRIVKLRLKAQANIKMAFRQTGSRCSFVEGTTPETVAANVGNKDFFRRKRSGRVKDPYHPNEKAAKKFFDVEMNHICQAVFNQLRDITYSNWQLRR
ncbi:MAG: SGNH/GDSL hydrolase family protein [Pseudomonadota bacterium]